MRRGSFRCDICLLVKLEKEAKAQGCKLLGAGKNTLYRLYKLPCGHQQEVTLQHMRTGNFLCSACLAEKLRREADSHHCKLLGPGKNRDYRLYELPCGHEQDLSTAHMRRNNFRCSTCLAEKLNQEAEAQGCKLLGPGSKTMYRTYRLACGHEQEVDTGGMRAGSFRCSTCLAEKLNQEAESQGCKLLGSGKNSHYRTYELPCGHEQAVTAQHMRIGNFRCAICMEERLHRDAEVRSCKLLGPGKNKNFRLYELPCGHEQQTQTGAMRIGNFRCRTCLNKKLNKDAAAQACKLLGPGKNKDYRLYELPCGHEQEVMLQHMRIGSFNCQACFDEKLKREAEGQGCKLLESGKSRISRIYELPCGHHQEINTTNLRAGSFRCEICLEHKVNQEAESQGCKLLGSGKSRHHRLYELPCGHEQEVTLQHMRTGGFLCQACEETSRTLPSNLYLLHIKVGSDEWLKLGYTKTVDSRVLQYGLLEAAEVTTVDSLHFATGNEAHAAESDIHKRYKRKRLPQKHMRAFHTMSGFTECYPATMLDTLLAELEALKSQETN